MRTDPREGVGMNSNDLAMELGTSSYKFAEFAGIPQGTELTGAEVEELTTKWYAEQHAAEDAEVAAMAEIEYHEDGSETIYGAYGEPMVSEDHTESAQLSPGTPVKATHADVFGKVAEVSHGMARIEWDNGFQRLSPMITEATAQKLTENYQTWLNGG